MEGDEIPRAVPNREKAEWRDRLWKGLISPTTSLYVAREAIRVSNDLKTKQRYLQIAIQEYEYSWAPEYDKRAMSPKAISEGTVDFDYGDTGAVEVAPDGAWVRARVWIPKSWL